MNAEERSEGARCRGVTPQMDSIAPFPIACLLTSPSLRAVPFAQRPDRNHGLFPARAWTPRCASGMRLVLAWRWASSRRARTIPIKPGLGHRAMTRTWLKNAEPRGYMAELLERLRTEFELSEDAVEFIHQELVRSFKNGLAKGRERRKDAAESGSLSLTDKRRRLR